MPIIPSGIVRLSQLIIDAAKDWGGFKIENLGAPNSGDDASRDDTIDTKIGTHAAIAAAHHAKYTDAEAVTAAKTDADIADAITKKHTQNTDNDLSPAHKNATTGVHGVGVSTVESTSGSQAKVNAHAGNASAHHVKTTSFADITDRAGASKLNWGLNKLLKGAGVGADPIEIDPIWTLLETLSPSGVTSITSSTFSTHDLWMVVISLETNGGADESVYLRLNGDSSSSYYARYFDGANVVNSGVQAQIIIGSGQAACGIVGIMYISGKRLGTSDYVTCFGGIGSGVGETERRGIDGRYDASADITSMTFFHLGTDELTGKIKIYYMDY